MPLPILLSRYHREANPLKALRLRCLDCCCGSALEVRRCSAVACPSWPFRMGTNPFRQKRVLSAEQKQAMTERLAKAEGGMNSTIDVNDARLTAPERHMLRQIAYRIGHLPCSSLPATYETELDRVFGGVEEMIETAGAVKNPQPFQGNSRG